MSVVQADVIDGIGLRGNGSAVEMLISDHLEWNDPFHRQLLGAKVEAYANTALSGGLVEAYPSAKGLPICIKLVRQHEPDASGVEFLITIREQLAQVGIAFEEAPLPVGY